MTQTAAAGNFFAYASAARRYAAGRPYSHPRVVGRVRGFLKFPATQQLPLALDVGCGTGQSTRTLRPLARRIVGVDVSHEMLAGAIAETRTESKSEPRSHVHYIRAAAEAIPLADASVDLITVGMAIHWFDRDRFLQESRRVLTPAGLARHLSGRLLRHDAREPALRRLEPQRIHPPRSHAAAQRSAADR